MTKTITDPAPIASSGATRRRLQPGEHADSPDGASGTGTTQTPGTGSPRAWSVCLGYSKRARWRFNRRVSRLLPSGLYRRPRNFTGSCSWTRHSLAGYTAGQDLAVITRGLTQTPKAVLQKG